MRAACPTGAAPTQIPDNLTGVWVSDYTMQPENGGLSVFAHEYAHDLGLPDEYDTSGNTGGASNTVEHWSLMAQSRGSLPRDGGHRRAAAAVRRLGKVPAGLVRLRRRAPGRPGTYHLRPGQSTSGSQSNGLVVLLPDKDVTFQYGAPCATCGEKFHYSGRATTSTTR